MLKSGLPEQRNYLDAILSEHIISNITKTDRIWEIKNRKWKMHSHLRNEYDQIFNRYSSKSADTLYGMLNDFILNRIDYIEIFINAVDEAEKQNKRCVIFTRSKKEADDIAEKYPSRIGRYPNKLTHTVLSYAEGTYGLNDLVIYDTIVMRPPEPDKLPQIKGRLDRPGQTKSKLSIVLILLQDTIEEAGLLRLELCNRFYSNYLMPLAEFYELAIKTSHHLSDSDIQNDGIKIKSNKIKSNKIKSNKIKSNKNSKLNPKVIKTKKVSN